MPSTRPELPRLVSHYIPEPSIIMFGCRSFIPNRGWNTGPNAPFHAPQDFWPEPAKPRPAEFPGPTGYDAAFPSDDRCPCCRGRIGYRYTLDADGTISWFEAGPSDSSHLRYCPWCDGMSGRNEAHAVYQRMARETWEDSEVAEAEIIADLKAMAETILSESDRRRLWNGCRGAFATETPENMIGSLGIVGRRFLVSIEQLPDWDLILDGKGRIVGRHSEPDGPEQTEPCPT